MANVLLNYDVKRTSATIHTELKERLISHYGYSPKIKADTGALYWLPNTTLVKYGTTRLQSSKDFLSACGDVNAVWERYIASEYSSASFDNQS